MNNSMKFLYLFLKIMFGMWVTLNFVFLYMMIKTLLNIIN